MACGSHTTVDPSATGVDLTVERPADTAIDQVRLSISAGSTVIFGPVFTPDVPRSFAISETLVVLLDATLDGQTVHLNVDGYSDGVGIANGSADAVISAKTLNPATATLAVLTTAPTCGDSICAADESACTCAQDCAAVCGDGCCTGTEKKPKCPADCL